MEKTAQTRISDLEIAAANKHAKRLLAHNDLEDSRLEELATLYTAAFNAGVSGPDALEISSGLLRSSYAPLSVKAYSIEDFLESIDVDRIEQSIAGVHEFLKTRDHGPPRIQLNSRVYERTPVRTQEIPRLIGLDAQYRVLDDYLFQLSSWNPLRLELDAQVSDWDFGILLHGPPGTGKSTLCKYAQQRVEHYVSMAGVPLTVESLQPTDFDMYLGNSEKNLKRKLDRISNPAGVGMLILEEVDMLTDNRKSSVSSARQGVMNTLMQSLSGFDAHPYKNFVVIGTSNVASNIDEGLDRRLSMKLHIPGFSQQTQYRSLANRSLGWADDSIREYVSLQGFERGLSPALMRSYCNFLSSKRLRERDESVFAVALEHRQEAFAKLYADLSLQEVRAATKDYSF